MQSSSGNSPQEDAMWRGRMRTGGALVAAGAACFLVHSILMLVGLGMLATLPLSSSGLGANPFVAMTTLFMVFLVALICVVLGSFLLPVGLLVHRGGTHGLVWRDPMSRMEVRVSSGTRAKAAAAAALTMAYGVLAILATLGTTMILSAVSALDVAQVLVAIELVFYSWVASSVVLVAAAALYASFLGGLRRETASDQTPSGAGFLAYAILNLIGTMLLVLPILWMAADPVSALSGGTISAAIGAFMVFLVLPIAGIIVFSFMIAGGLALRNLQAGPTLVPVAYVPTLIYPVYTAPYPAPYVAPYQPQPPPASPPPPPPPPTN